MPTYSIDEQFRDLCPRLSEDATKRLTVSILRDGCMDPIKVWNGVVVDGMNRHRICTEHDKPFPVAELDFADRDEAIEWIVNNQLGRRNLDARQRDKLLADLAAARSKKGGHKPNVGIVDKIVGGEKMPAAQCAANPPPTAGRVSEEIAAEQGMSVRAVETSIATGKALNSMPKSVASAILGKTVNGPRKDIAALAALPPEQQEQVVGKCKELGLKLGAAISLVAKKVDKIKEDVKANGRVKFDWHKLEVKVGGISQAIDDVHRAHPNRELQDSIHKDIGQILLKIRTWKRMVG